MLTVKDFARPMIHVLFEFRVKVASKDYRWKVVNPSTEFCK